MIFNSIHFAIFLPIVFIIYWFVVKRSLQYQNIWLLITSFYFYACWDYKFLFLLFFSISLDYFTGIKIYDSKSCHWRRVWLWISVGINLGLLGVFKYYNFFAESFAESLEMLGFQANLSTLNIILPVGISFYTFHGLSYIIDIYKGRIPAERNFADYAVFVSFFPLLVAGPIERATHLLPQIKIMRKFDYLKAVDGLRQILWGLFKKVVIADNCAEFANQIFNNSANASGSELVFGAFFFAIQIYCDFSGYSDIALGTARLFGIDLLRNFAFPYFSRDIAEFWRRWHISLSSWFKDYLYVPLGGSKGGMWMKIRNTFIIFLVSGFWHGANWTFIVWGLLNALYIMPSIVLGSNRKNLGIVAAERLFPSFKEIVQIVCTFTLTLIAWIVFRAESIGHAYSYIIGIFDLSLFTLPELSGKALLTLFFTAFLFSIEWLGRNHQYGIEKLVLKWNKFYRISFYYMLLILIFLFGGTAEEFIYFQF